MPPADLGVELVTVPIPPALVARAQRVVRPRAMLARGAFAERVAELAARADLVHAVEVEAALAVDGAPVPHVAQLHFVTRRDRADRRPWTRAGRIHHEYARAERRVHRRTRWLLANSDEVAAELRAEAPRAHVAVAPLALDPAPYAPPAPLETPVAGLIGTADWPPTRSAVERLITTVWPQVLHQRPDARLALAGVGMEAERFPGLRRLPGVEWHGFVESATDFLRGLGIMLYPLTAGSGAKVKVLEALALGVPVITTPDGAEGIVGREGMVVDTADEALVGAAVRLLGDGGARRAAGAAARRTFAEHHVPRPAAVPVIELYERMLR